MFLLVKMETTGTRFQNEETETGTVPMNIMLSKTTKIALLLHLTSCFSAAASHARFIIKCIKYIWEQEGGNSYAKALSWMWLSKAEAPPAGRYHFITFKWGFFFLNIHFIVIF